MKDNILLVGFKLTIGTELYLEMLTKSLTEKNISHSICGDRNFIYKKKEGVPIAKGGNGVQMFIDTINPFNWWKYLKCARNSDIIFFMSPHPLNNIAGLLTKILSKSKIISQIHDPIPHTGISCSRIILASQKLQANISDKIIVAGESLKCDLMGIYRQKAEKIHVLPLGAHRQEKTLNDYVPKVKRKYISVLGRIEDYKGIDIFLEAALKIVNENENVVFLIAGKGDLAKYQELLNKLPVAQVEVRNYLITNDEFDDIIFRSYVTVLPYKDGTQTGTIQIAYWNQTPVLVSNVGSLGENVIDGKTGYLVKPNDSSDLTKKIKIILNLQNLNEIDYEAFLYYIENLKWSEIIKKFIRITKEL